jgi:hypothetical protein
MNGWFPAGGAILDDFGNFERWSLAGGSWLLGIRSLGTVSSPRIPGRERERGRAFLSTKR